MRDTRLSVNLNKVALLRNSRRTGVPDLLQFARIVHDAGADGITVHPRPDERHIRGSDLPALAGVMAPWRPGFELNVEGYPDERLMEIVKATRPEQVTLVPDAPSAFNSRRYAVTSATCAGSVRCQPSSEVKAPGASGTSVTCSGRVAFTISISRSSG